MTLAWDFCVTYPSYDSKPPSPALRELPPMGDAGRSCGQYFCKQSAGRPPWGWGCLSVHFRLVRSYSPSVAFGATSPNFGEAFRGTFEAISMKTVWHQSHQRHGTVEAD